MRLAITYDISDNRTRTRVFKILESYGAWKQYSVFELEVSDIMRLQMEDEIKAEIDIKCASTNFASAVWVPLPILGRRPPRKNRTLCERVMDLYKGWVRQRSIF